MTLKTKILILLGATFLSGCSVTPKVDENKTIAFSGNDENAGIIGFYTDGSLEITEDGRSRFNALIELFGERTIPKTSKDFGMLATTEGHYSLTREAAERWYQLKLISEKDRVDKSK